MSYIRRKAALDIPYKVWYEIDENNIDKFRDMVQDALEQLPSAQPEIIRCKDCKHFATINEPYNETFCRLCFMNKSEMGYCDKAERRTDE